MTVSETPSFGLQACARERVLGRARDALLMLDTSEEVDKGAQERMEKAIDAHLDRAFEMGFAASLWRGIEDRLPEDVAVARGKMPPDLERVAAAHTEVHC